MNFSKQVSPHIKRKASTSKQMLEFFLAVFLLFLCSFTFYTVKRGYKDGCMVLLLGFVSMAFSVLADVIYYAPTLVKEEYKGRALKEYFYKIIHSYSYVSGLLLLLLCPLGILWWQLALTSFIATFIMKLLFGGFGSNIINPAVFGRLFAQFTFSQNMTTFLPDYSGIKDVTTGATITGIGNISIYYGPDASYSILDLFLGNYFGSLGETFCWLLILIGVYLSFRKIIDWRVPVFYIGSLLLAFIVLFAVEGYGLDALFLGVSYTMVGGIFFCGILCLTDPVTSPTSHAGKITFALTSAIFTFLFRVYLNLPEGAAFSVIIVNFFTPFIDKIFKGRTREKTLPVLLTSLLALILIALTLGYGLTNKIEPTVLSLLKEVAL